jgi:DNA primase
VAGRIRDEDVAAVRERSPIDEVIGEHVALRNAGGGNLKGICPFHDEKSPSLSVSPSRGLFHCFGCGVGGDVIRFVERIEHTSFAEAVERLAASAGVQLRYVEGPAPARPAGQRVRLVEAHAAAAAFYAEQLRTAEAAPARAFLTERGFDDAAAATFGCGYAPAAWDALTTTLLGRRFTQDELITAGLSRRSSRGSLIDRFHRRLLWPIRDVTGEVVGFGARRLFDDDPIEAKYLNTPETPIYKKSQLLYGMDLAKRDIARQHRAVIVEGYTDVMAAHLAGVPTAVATCGTAFGGEHIALLRRLLMDSDASGEVIFTFDGDAAGMKAAERAFADDQKFIAQTFVAIEPTGLDPCELRQKAGDEAVRDLVARRVPLVQFVLRSIVERQDLDTAEGRTAALDRGIPLIAKIKDIGLREDYGRRLAGMVGLFDEQAVLTRLRAYTKTGGRSEQVPRRREPAPVDDGVASVEREVLKLAMQMPAVAGPGFDAIEADAFLVPEYRTVRAGITAAGGTNRALSGPAWASAVIDQMPDLLSGQLVHALAVEPLHTVTESPEAYGDVLLARLQEIVVARQVTALKSRVQRMNPQENADEHSRLSGELFALEMHRIRLRERAIGGL